jgi:DNA invertase Pin-like site-specific DNA recombinase
VNPSPPSGRRVGYARVSTDDQNLSLQLDALAQCGVGADLIFTDKQSGAKDDRPGLARCLKTVQPGDTLVVWRLDRLGRSMRHLVTVIADLRERGIGFRSISDGMIGTTSASGELVFHIFSALAQFERRLIQERTNAGLAAARARGRKGGRPRLAEAEPRIQLARKLHADSGVTLDAICKTLHISRTTYYRYVKAGRKAGRCRPPLAGRPPDGTGAAGVRAPVVDTRPAAG